MPDRGAGSASGELLPALFLGNLLFEWVGRQCAFGNRKNGFRSFAEPLECVRAFIHFRCSGLHKNQFTAVTGQVKIVFDSEGLAETMHLLRLASGNASDVEVTTAETFQEILRLSDDLKPLLKLGHLFKIDSEIMEAT